MKYKEQIKYILQDCDFNRIHKAMVAINQTWKFEGDKNFEQIPTVSDLRSVAEDCLNKVAYSKNESAECNIGGFEAEKIKGILELRFVLERVSTLKILLNPNTKDELAREA